MTRGSGWPDVLQGCSAQVRGGCCTERVIIAGLLVGVLPGEFLGGGLDGGGVEPVVDVAAVPGAVDQQGSPQDLQVVADQGLRQAGRLGELLDAGLLVGSGAQRGEQAQASGIGEGLEPGGQVLPVLRGRGALEVLLGRRRRGGHRRLGA